MSRGPDLLHVSTAAAPVCHGDTRNTRDLPTDFVDKHPGGKEMLALSAGRDCTDLVRSYHPFTDKPYAILEKMAVSGIIAQQPIVTMCVACRSRWKLQMHMIVRYLLHYETTLCIYS